jgi:uncharacterized protein YbcI
VTPLAFLRGRRGLFAAEARMEWTLQQLSTSLAESIARFEEEEMGVRPARVTVMVEEDLVMVHLKEVLSPSERALASTESGQALLQRFNTSLINAGSFPSIRDQVSQALQREVVEVQISLSSLSGSLVIVFTLGQRLTPAEA